MLTSLGGSIAANGTGRGKSKQRHAALVVVVGVWCVSNILQENNINKVLNSRQK